MNVELSIRSDFEAGAIALHEAIGAIFDVRAVSADDRWVAGEGLLWVLAPTETPCRVCGGRSVVRSMHSTPRWGLCEAHKAKARVGRLAEMEIARAGHLPPYQP